MRFRSVATSLKSPNFKTNVIANALTIRRANRLTAKGLRVALLLLFAKQLCGPLGNSRFHYQPNRKLETASHKDQAIQQIVDLLVSVMLRHQMLKYCCLRSSN